MGIEGFPRVTRTVQPEGYDGLVFTLVVNLSGATFDALLTDGDSFGAALVTAYCGQCIEWHGYTFDFSTPEAARATLADPDLPIDLRWWLRNAPIEAIDVYLEQLRKNFRRSFEPTSS